MSEQELRSIQLSRTGLGRYEVSNERGGRMPVSTVGGSDFTPVELLLAAIAACSAADVDHITVKRAEPTRFAATMTGDKVRGESGNQMTNLKLVFDIGFADDEAGAAAAAVLPRAAAQSHDRLCTVSRTVELATPIEVEVNP
jgi:uncharacterized OsmC-like protein